MSNVKIFRKIMKSLLITENVKLIKNHLATPNVERNH